MKKISLIAILMFSVVTIISAQKIDRENIGRYNYVQKPLNTLLVQYQTFRVEAEGQYSDAYRRDAIIGYVKLAGYEKVAEGAECD
ncbi:MAG: hypothetical protein MI922_30305, partial [Bacteroidales bacterium]|nr:hypothetical protein [Bacteroidales bacterium]